MSLSVRPAKPEDVNDIHDMIVELAVYEREPDAVSATPDDLHATLFSSAKSASAGPAAYAHVAEVDGQVVGFALWFLNYSTWLGKHGIYLEDLYVRPTARGQGAGKAMLAQLAALCVDRGYGRLDWSVLDWNSPAIDFYRAHGAISMDEWTGFRLTGQALVDFARS